MSIHQVTRVEMPVIDSEGIIDNSLRKTKFSNIQVTRMLRQFVPIASCDGVMKRKQIVKRYTL